MCGKTAATRSLLLEDSFSSSGSALVKEATGELRERFLVALARAASQAVRALYPFTSQKRWCGYLIVSGVEPPTIGTPVAFLKQASLFSGESRGIRSVGVSFSGTSKVFGSSRSTVAALRSFSPFPRRPRSVGLHREQPLAKMGSGVTLSFCTCRALKSSQRSRKAVRNSGNESAARVAHSQATRFRTSKFSCGVRIHTPQRSCASSSITQLDL